MTAAVLYRWKLKPGREAEFREAWTEGTKRIHKRCGSHGAILHEGEDGTVWSYASWPNEETRQQCFAEHDWFAQDCFKTMQDCIAERFDEILLTATSDELADRTQRPDMPVMMTERLVLRPMVMSDAEAFLPALSTPENMTYWSSGPMETLDQVRDYISGNVFGAAYPAWVAAEQATPDNALGWVVLMDRKDGIAEMGWMFRPDCQGKGYAYEAALPVMRHGFENRGYRRIFADVDPDNTPSIKLIEKLGMQLEGRARGAWNTHIGVRDSLIYARLASDPDPV